jgi:hypothetical protein
MKHFISMIHIAGFLGLAAAGQAEDLTALCAERAAIERVYHNRRLGEKAPFEQALPDAAIRRLVERDLRKEIALKRAYGLEVSHAQVEAEVRRIESSTRAPEVLAELKVALGNDPRRFARAVARPLVVERELRDRFGDDATLHARQRQQAEEIRARLRAARDGGATTSQLVALLKTHQPGGVVAEHHWCLNAKATQGAPASSTERDMSSERRPEKPADFRELRGPLRQVLAAQMRAAGDLSAVIETPDCFLLYVATEKTTECLRTVSLSLPKHSFEEWLNSFDP